MQDPNNQIILNLVELNTLKDFNTFYEVHFLRDNIHLKYNKQNQAIEYFNTLGICEQQLKIKKRPLNIFSKQDAMQISYFGLIKL